MKIAVAKAIYEHDDSFKESSRSQLGSFPLPVTHPVEPLDPDFALAYIEDLKINGFGRGAVVIDARQTFKNRIDPFYWGFVVGFNNRTAASSKPALLNVKWAYGSNEEMSEKDILLLHPAPESVALHRLATPTILQSL